jgi:predicted house-cleaning noncanonical NTP pyrophosphatase (MazG superfamily)
MEIGVGKMVRNILLVSILGGLLLTGCSSETNSLTQHDCLEQDQFKYNDECVDYDDIPQDELEDVWNEVADEIAEAQGISKKEALQMILDKMEDRAGQ